MGTGSLFSLDSFNDNRRMQTHTLNLWGLRIVTLIVAALAAASAAFWVLKSMSTAPTPNAAPVVFTGMGPADPLAVARLLGGGQAQTPSSPAPSAASRFKLTGVVADRANGGYALISVDGQPAKPYRVGAQVDDTLVLRSVSPRSAALAASTDAPATITLDLPTLSPP